MAHAIPRTNTLNIFDDFVTFKEKIFCIFYFQERHYFFAKIQNTKLQITLNQIPVDPKPPTPLNVEFRRLAFLKITSSFLWKATCAVL